MSTKQDAHAGIFENRPENLLALKCPPHSSLNLTVLEKILRLLVRINLP